jgi:hypothetical protein
VSPRDLFPTLFSYFEIGDVTLAERITEVFAERNAIMHGHRKWQVSERPSDAALTTAEFLEAALARTVSAADAS